MKIKDMFSSIKNSFGETVGYIDIFDEIGESWGQNGAKDFINQYRELEKTCSKIVINMNSPGGSVFTGQQIASYILSSKIPTECHIGALCASIATVIACACDKVIMPSNALWLSHSPISGQGGNAHDLRKMADLLDKIEETILNIYENKCGGKKTRDELMALTTGDDEDGQGTWLDAYECLEIGFVDEIAHELAMVAKYEGPSNIILNGTNIDLSNFKNTEKIKELIEDRATTYQNLPLAPREHTWDAPSAQKRVRAFFNCEDAPNAQYKKAFLWYDESQSDLFGSYKLPFADIVDGQLKAIYRGLSAAKGRLNQTDIPSSDKAKIEAILRKYYKKAQKEYNDPNISYDNNLEETKMSNTEKQGVLEMINNVAKTLLGIKDEVQEQEQIQEPQVENVEPQAEVQNEQPVEEVQAESQEQEEIQGEVHEVEVQDAPEQEEPVAEAQEPEAEVVEQSEVVAEPQQEEPEQEPQEEATEEVQEVVEETPAEEIEPSEAEVVQNEAVIPEVEASVNLAEELAIVKAELNKIKEADAQKAIKLAKAELAKEVENKFKGVPGKVEDKVDFIFELKNSTLSDSAKEMVFKSLENLSEKNLADCQELGHSEETQVEELDEMSKARALAQKEGISEGKALLVLSNKMSLEEAKARSKK